MASTKSNVRKLKTQPKLTDEELQRLAQKIAVALEHDSEEIGMLLMLFDQLETTRENYVDFFNIISTVKQHLFIGTDASLNAQDQFQADAYRERGKLLLWPYERKGTS